MNQKNLFMGFSCNYCLSNYINIKNLMLWNNNIVSLYKDIYIKIYIVIYVILKGVKSLKIK